MSTTIQIKRSSTASAVPLSGDLAVGELAVNLADKRLFAKQADGTIIELSTNPTDLDAATLRIDGVEITASATELNSLDGLTATTAELNILDGVTATATEINVLDGITSTTTELNKLDGFTGSTAELNLLDGVTATTAELNVLDGITATTAELNYTDGVTSNIQIQLSNKQPLDAQLTDISILIPTDGSFIVGNGVNFVAESGNTAIASLGVTATAAELNTLDGVTASTTELNYTDGVTSNIQTQLNSKAATTTSPTITLAGDLSGSATLTNLGNATLTATVADDSHNHVISNVDGLQTALDSKANLSGANFTGSVDVTGTITADGLVVDGSGFIELRGGGIGQDIEWGSSSQDYAAIRVTSPSAADIDLDIHTSTAAGTDGTPLRAKFSHNGDVSFYEDTGTTAKFVWDASAESLGIGTASPSGLLELSAKNNGSENNTLRITDQDTFVDVGDTLGKIEFYATDGAGVKSFIKSEYATAQGLSDLVLGVASEAMRIDYNGNVGIGTASPNYKLEVNHTGDDKFAIVTNDEGNVASETGVYFRTTTKGVIGTGTAAALAFEQGGSERARIDSSGNLLVGTTSSPTGSGQIVANNGIYLGGTGAANKLDDYEEGTWTPDARFTGGNVGVTHTEQQGGYIKVGSQVTAYFELRLSSKGTSTGDFRVYGLPFTANLANGVDWVGNACSNYASMVSLNSPPTSYLRSGQSYLSFTHFNLTGSGDVSLNDTNVSDTLVLGLTVTYQTNA